MKTYIHILIFSVMTMLSLQTRAVVHTVQVSNFSFQPANLTGVLVGDVVHFVWVSGVHTTTSGTIPASAATWDAPITSSQTTYDYVVTVPGVYNYVCTPHAGMGMVGSFTVTSGMTLSVTPGNQNVAASSGTANFAVTTTGSWVATCSSSWCLVTPAGTGNGTLVATYSANTSVEARMAEIVVTVAGLPSKTVTVSQAGAAPTLQVLPANQPVVATAGSTSFTVTANTNWTAVSDALWCSPTPSGPGNGTLTAAYGENTSVNTRTATITVSVNGIPSQTVTVSQDGSGVGIGNRDRITFSVFPNPASSRATVRFDEPAGTDARLELVDICGKTVYSTGISGESTHQMDISSFPHGIYFIRLTSNGRDQLKKLILE